MLTRRAVDNSSLMSMFLMSASTFRGLHSRIGSCSSYASYSASSLQPALYSDRSDNGVSDVDWDKLEFGVVQTDYMYVMKCARDEKFLCGEINRYGNIEMNPASGVLTAEGLAPINLLVQDEIHRAAPGGTGGMKTITNYAPVLKAQMTAKSKGFTDGGAISTPLTRGTILSGITRRSVIEIARDYGYQVEERLVSVEDLMDADEVFCTVTAVVVSPVGSIIYHGQRFEYKTGSETVSRKLYKSLTEIQMGLEEDKNGWTVEID